MSQALKQSGVASGVFGLYLLHEFVCHSGDNNNKKKKSALISFEATTTRKTQVLDEKLLTDADLNISEDEACTPGRWEGSSGENMWKTFGLRTGGCDMYSTSWKTATAL